MPKYKSRICEAVHETASDMHCGGCITDAEMREFDALCLEPVPSYDADTIRKLRKRLDVSQVMLAQHQRVHGPEMGSGGQKARRSLQQPPVPAGPQGP